MPTVISSIPTYNEKIFDTFFYNLTTYLDFFFSTYLVYKYIYQPWVNHNIHCAIR